MGSERIEEYLCGTAIRAKLLAMDPYQFSFASFASLMLPLVVVPTLLGAGIIWMITRSAQIDIRTVELPIPAGGRRWAGWLTGGRLGLWATGALGVILGFIACVGWLSWTAMDHDGGFTGPGLPAPTSFPMWQVIACGATMISAAILASLCSRRLVPGALAAALGTAAGFSTGFSLGAATEVTSQEGIGVGLSMTGFTIGLGTITLLVALLRAWQLQRNL